MALAYINISTKQYFNFMCKTEFERRIFHDSYREFQKKSKVYSLNQRLHTFAQMCDYNEKAISLNYKLNNAVINSIEALENQMPNLKNKEGQSILFDHAEFQICSSDLMNKGAHVVSLTYTSPKLVLHEIIADALVLSYDLLEENEPFLLQMTSDLVINYERSEELVCS
ncbi:hypothetical protein [Pedobacter rhizosphaerae]|uniref:Uncharacterized protein n=1 Tax=Pedobacter rhizosphaerae TaxID=390241 RepID=A0A1H9LNZ0_9SPHI|nr:hypothetical protein [Pedobacter rhizosphaerae]SER12603.1 hypothetical protein SAMN04488023_104211 [Pedobacter rhizosphaerae]